MANSDQIYETLHSPFSIERHKKTFTAYLEAVMYEDGTVEYAVPSHQNKLIEICMKNLILRIENSFLICALQSGMQILQNGCAR